jgi:AcrR family transcriptional regulator
LSIDDWVEAGHAILAEEGIKALKIDRLCERLSVTKGSFYWHFTDMPSYRVVLVQSWVQSRDDARRKLEQLSSLPPRERLSRMMSSLVSPRHWMLERAMREWARSDDAVAASVADGDRRVVRAVRRAFTDFGFDPDEADLRAAATFAAGIGFLHLGGPTPRTKDAGRRERFLDLMFAR